MNSPNPPLRIVLAEDDEPTAYALQKLLSGLGHEVAAVARTGAGLIDQCRRLRPAVVVADIKMPDMDGIRAAESLCREMPAPVLLISAYDEEELIERARACPSVMAYLLKPVSEADLKAAIPVTLARFGQVRSLMREAAEARQALEDRKVIERAKGAIMRRLGVDEREGHRRLQRLANDQNRKLTEVAWEVIKAEEVYLQVERTHSRAGN